MARDRHGAEQSAPARCGYGTLVDRNSMTTFHIAPVLAILLVLITGSVLLERGAVTVDENFMTTLDGTSLIVWVIAGGRKMAAGTW